VVAVTPMIAHVMPEDPGFLVPLLAAVLVAFVVMAVITGGIAVAIVGPRRRSQFLVPALAVFAVFSLLYGAFGGYVFALLVAASGLVVAALAPRRRRDLVLPGIAGGVAFWVAPFFVSSRVFGAEFGVGQFTVSIAAALVVALVRAAVAWAIRGPRVQPAPGDAGLH
jgi:hypothetical protein